MEPEPTARYRLLTHIGDTDYRSYLTSASTRRELCYPALCLEPPTEVPDGLIGLDCEMVVTDLGDEVVSIVIINQKEQVVFDQKFLPKGQIVNYLSEITGLNKNSFLNITNTLEAALPKIKNIIKNKVIVGHDLSHDMRVLGVQHNLFIDTLDVFPHKNGLPLKSKLKDLALRHINMPIQYGVHNPKEDALAALRLAKFHISKGRGLVQFVPGKPQVFMKAEDICREACLDIDKVLWLVLRGSRAGGFEGPDSDYDYIMVYDTETEIDGALVQLYNVDIALYDKKSFAQYMVQNDISLLEPFYNPEPNIILVKKVEPPQIDLMRLREKTTQHVYKSLIKARKYVGQLNNIHKGLKCIHMAWRFYDYYAQFAEKGYIYDHRKMLKLWKQIEQDLNTKKHLTPMMTYTHYMTKIEEYSKEFRAKYPTIFHGATEADKEDEKKKYKYQTRKEPIDKTKYQEDIKELLRKGTTNTQKYLREHGTKYIMDDFKVKIERHCKYPHLIQLHYLIHANFSYNIPRECRGLVLDEQDDYRIVAFPYLKFFDYNDPKYSDAKNFKLEGSRVYEKLDGSTATLYHYDGKWHVASSSKPDAAGDYCYGKQEHVTKFNDQFWRVFYASGYQLPGPEDEHKTFVFEMMCVNHLIVVNHKQDRLVLHGVRSNLAPFEQQWDLESYTHKYKWQIVQPFFSETKPIQEVALLCKDLDPRKQEGFVMVDQNFNRLKVKSARYLLANFTNPVFGKTINLEFLVELIVTQEYRSFMEYCPEWKEALQTILDKIQNRMNKIFDMCEKNKHLTPKQFSEVIKKEDSKKLEGLIFKAYRGKIDRENVLTQLELKTIIDLIS